VATQELLCIISAVAYFLPFCGFMARYARSRWATYLVLAFFCVLRIICYSLGAYYSSPAMEYPSIKYVHYYVAKITFNAIGTVIMMIGYGELYKSIVPKIYQQHHHIETAFEKFAFHYIKLPFFPFAGCLIAGCIMANPLYSLEKQHNGVILRKVSILLLLALNSLFIYISAIHARRYPAHKHAFLIAFSSTFVFTIAVIYNVVITYNVSTSVAVWPAYVFAPLPEVLSLAILSVDLQTYFLGRNKVEEMDEVHSPDEKAQV